MILLIKNISTLLEPVHVKVLQHHIDEGAAQSVQFCAVAMALREQFPEAAVVKVGIGITIDDNYWITPVSVRKWIVRFDNYEPVDPFEFDLS